MSSTSTVTVTLAVHVDKPGNAAIRVSETGDDAKAFWLPRSTITEFDLTGKTTRGTDRNGQTVDLPLAEIEISEWVAKREGLI
jgi:hypothetical protein